MLVLGQLHPLRIDSSRLALDAIAAAVRALPRPSGDSAPSWLKEVVVDASLRAYGVSMGSLGSRLALALFHGDRAWVAHVGDVVVSIARRTESHELVELTADHTLLRKMRESGTPAAEIEEAQRAFDPDQVLTRGFGYGWDPEPEVCEVAVSEGDVLVLAHRSFVREVIEQVPIDREIRAGDKGIWHRLWLDEAARRDARSPAPPGTTELLLPRETLVHVHAQAFSGDHPASIYFFGWFGDVARPPIVELGPVSGDDALALAEALKSRLGLPLRPTVCTAEELDDRLPRRAYVVATGDYRETYERPNFGRVRLGGSVFHALKERGIAEGRYRVAGFYHRLERSPDEPPIVGYGGPRLDVIDLEAVREN